MKKIQALFISDVHLGSRGSNADSLLSLLKTLIIPVSSIVGPNGTIHTGNGGGWGFNIQTDPIHVTYLRYIP